MMEVIMTTFRSELGRILENEGSYPVATVVQRQKGESNSH
jgi:hypothetical protein